MVIHITEYIILTVSRYLIICEPLDHNCSPSQSLCSVLTRNDQNPGKGVYMPIHPIFYLRTTGSTAYAGFSMRILVCMELHSIGNASQSMFIQRTYLFHIHFECFPLKNHIEHKYLVKCKICLPSLWKNPVKVNCRCEDKLKNQQKNAHEIWSYQGHELKMKSQKLFQYGCSGIFVPKNDPVMKGHINSCGAVLPWRILLSLHLLHCLQHIIHFEYFPGWRNSKSHRLKMN